MARDAFWELLIDLSRNQGVTIFVSTHFMNEAARCDRISLMDAGRVLATDTPAGLVRARGARTLEDAFVDYLEEAAEARGTSAAQARAHDRAFAGSGCDHAPPPRNCSASRRMLAYAVRESLELMRDPIRLGFALGGTAFLMLVFGFGITTDVNSLTFAVLDRDDTYASRAYLEELRGSAYFVEQPPLKDAADLQDRLKTGRVSATVEIPPGFGRDIKRGRPTEVGVWIDGAMPFRAETIRGYLQGVHQQFLADPAIRGNAVAAAAVPPANIEISYRYNQDFDSVYAMVPAQIALQLALIPAILMALAIVREKELGSIINLYVTPVTRLEFLLGKQIPYIVVAMINFVVLLLMALFIFGVPLKGSLPLLALAALVYVTTTTAYGRVISTFTSTQIAALFGTAILTVLPATMFAGMLVPISSITGMGAILGRLFPMTYFLPISVGTFTKGLGFADLSGQLLIACRLRPGADAAQPRPAAPAGKVGGMRTLSTIFWLATKELRSLFRDWVLLGLVVYSFSLAIIAQAQSNTQELHNASIGIVDEDHSELSRRIARAFLPPYFKPAEMVEERDVDHLMNIGKYTFIVDIPPHFERDVLGGRNPSLQVAVDATAVVQAGIGSGYAQQIISTEIDNFVSRAAKRAAAARQSFGPHRLQSQRHDRLVHQHHGHHQQRDHAGDHSCRSSRRSRARAWHDGPSPCHADQPVRDRHVENPGEQPRHHRGGRPLALYRRAAIARHPDRGIGAALHAWRGALSVFRHVDRRLSGDHRAHHASARVALSSRRCPLEHAVGRQHAARKHAAVPAHPHAGVAVDPFRLLCPGNSLSRRGLRCRVAGISRPSAAIGMLFLGLGLLRFRSVAAQAS